ncbi:FtsW/RodA/SpoVE family cell cycle protein [Kocuria soli]|uniref:peptidoglycan glycosyltransferase n=1 Tax=Kocuria soli TaxID=2485125 RepID=A0A3N3ZQJ3_9MICC|nr:FtsW/RodA/SpoVE family cell cycle protein [Kocuria soli]ROZ61596.1 FtsW/RodA/SpoVE family cell cycle protein [Kocuria soli]
MTAAPTRGTPATDPVQATSTSTGPVQRRRRITELVLLFVAWAIGIGANVLIDPEQAMASPGHVYRAAAVLIAGGLVLHAVMWFRAQYADPYILPIVVALNGLGIAMIHRIDLLMDATAATNQVLWTAIGVLAAALVLVFLRDHRRLRRFTYISLVASALLLVLPLLPGLGTEINGARIWISIGGRTFQPGEIAKITLAIFFAGYLSTNRDVILLAGPKIGPVRLPRFRDLAPMFAAWLVSIGVLVLQRDLGTAILFFGLFVAMLYLATGRLSWIVLGLIFVAAGGVVASQTFGHVAARLDAWWHAFDPAIYDAPVGGSRQIVQGIFGLASGGLFGQGLGQGRPDLVSYSNSDMIITAFGEELGLIGLGAILMMFFLLVSRGFRAALGTPDAFGKLLAGGLASIMVIQLFVVIGGVTRVIPLTGLTTPFMSAGGSSLLSNWIIAALLLAISHSARRPVVTGPASDQDIAEFQAHEREEHERAEMLESERAERAERRRARQEAARKEREERKARQAEDERKNATAVPTTDRADDAPKKPAPDDDPDVDEPDLDEPKTEPTNQRPNERKGATS